MGDWLDDLFEQKQAKEELLRIEGQRQHLEELRVQALLPEFWRSITEALDAAMRRYNEKAGHSDKLISKVLPAEEQFQIWRERHPPRQLTVQLQRALSRVNCRAEYVPAYAAREFKVRFGDDKLYLENQAHRAMSIGEFLREALKDFFEYLQNT